MKFTWQNGRQLATLTKNDKTTSYSYDISGIRTQKSIDGTVTKYYYDDSNNLVSMTVGDKKLMFYYDANGSVSSVQYNNAMYYYVKNLQGDITRIVDENGNIVAIYSYDHQGKPTTMRKPSNTDVDIVSYNPFLYRGYVYDSDSGLYYLQSRYYDPVTGRFINADMYCDTGTGVLGTNMFAYCENNPISNVDEHGESINRTWKEVKKYINLGIHYGHTIIRKLGVDTAGIGAWFLQMKKDRYGVYHATFNCWQQYFGYNDLYDIVFAIGTSMVSKKYVFTYNKKSYVLWAWKGDYINLGAGAELGIYTGGEYHWTVNKSLALPMSMYLKYKNKKIIYYYCSNAWWITGFNPKYQNVKAKNLSVEFTINFRKQKGLFKAFYKKYKGYREWKFKYSKYIAILKF
ncbi:RHS repeat-associated core domain-containing protein [Ruminococcus sp. zg-921]|nr:RHS repeat-associated core domain-containing protein [Ruminococcus sp. zg-921]MCQ4115607.1 DUF4474 domain-containing protein [Ruminococcus sp. zg-921]